MMAEDTVNLLSLLSSENRDFLVRNNRDEVKIKELAGKNVGLYFSASWCPPCRGFTPVLSDVYNKLTSSKGDFEVVFVSSDREEDAFNGYFSKMPWLAVPFSDRETIKHLGELFKVTGIPHLAVIDASGRICTSEGVALVREYGVKGYPFTLDRIKELEEEAKEAKKHQTLNSVLVSDSRDYVVSNDGNKIPVFNLEGKIVGLYIAVTSYGRCAAFTTKLAELYHSLKEVGENFEVVLIPLDDDEEEFKQGFAAMPWLSLPFEDPTCEKLVRYFELEDIPMLVILGPNGKTLILDATELIEEHGIQAYPFTPEKLAELADIEKAKRESQTLESLLVSERKDFVLDKSGSQVPVSSLVGKHILLYFSAHWCPPCRHFTPELIEAYHEIKAKEGNFEIIFISSDRDLSSFDEYYSSMPWLALPFGDERKPSLANLFKVRGIPCLVAIGPDGKTITTEARPLVQKYGADAFPFTDDRSKQLEQQLEEAAKTWPDKLKLELHEHDLLLERRPHGYICDGCNKTGHSWSYNCKECDFDLHPKCALKKDETENSNQKGVPMEGFICEGDVCRKI